MSAMEQAARQLLAIADTATAEREPWSLEDMRASADALRAALDAGQAQPVAPTGWKLVPVEPTLEHLRSMAIRHDHGLGLDGYYDQPGLAWAGVTHAQRLDAAIRSMRQLYEEAIGEGFFRIDDKPASPPARQPLTDEQIAKIVADLEADVIASGRIFSDYGRSFDVSIARAIERAHGIT